ncbi:MAG TPA: hypothetical protein DCG37_07570 [Lachnospiraceae bacterium]|nr:hypothetical protein [Lachnospiraceae bacterium]
MPDEKKVRAMIDLARYENGEGREDIRIRRYYRTDYMALQLIKSWIFTSIGYFLILALIVAGNLEYLLNNIDSFNLKVLGSWLLIGYILFVGIYLAIAYISSLLRYNRARRNIQEYLTKLRRLLDMQ